MLIIATAILIAWLFVELGRFAFGDLRFVRIRGGSLQSASSAPIVSAAEPESRSEPEAHRSPGSPRPGGSGAATDDDVLYDEADVERAIRDRLYGGSRRHRT